TYPWSARSTDRLRRVRTNGWHRLPFRHRHDLFLCHANAHKAAPEPFWPVRLWDRVRKGLRPIRDWKLEHQYLRKGGSGFRPVARIKAGQVHYPQIRSDRYLWSRVWLLPCFLPWLKWQSRNFPFRIPVLNRGIDQFTAKGIR